MSSHRMFKIKLAVGTSTEYPAPDLFGFMQVILEDVGSPDLTPPTPKSVAEVLICIARLDNYSGIETGLYEVSLDCRNNRSVACEKYCLSVIKEMKKSIKKRQA